MSDTEGRFESQFEAAQEATPGSPQEGGPKWHERFRRQRKKDIAEQAGPQGVRDRVTAWYYRLPLVRRVALWTVVIILFAALPAMLPYITADSQYWTLILVKIGIAALLALGLNVV